MTMKSLGKNEDVKKWLKESLLAMILEWEQQRFIETDEMRSINDDMI